METTKLTKVCKRCGKEKPLDEFAKSSRSVDGHQPWCKECQSEHYRLNYAERKKELKMQKKQKQTEATMYDSPVTILPKGLSIPTRPLVEPDPLPKPKTAADVLKELSTHELLKIVKSRKDFSIKEMFTPRELMETLYAFGYRGSLDIMVKQTVTLSPHE